MSSEMIPFYVKRIYVWGYKYSLLYVNMLQMFRKRIFSAAGFETTPMSD